MGPPVFKRMGGPLAVDVEAAYRAYGPMVLRRCRRLLRHENQAVDAMHDVFVQLLRHRRTLQGTAPASLLYRIATHVCLNRLRTARRKPEDAEDALVLTLACADDLEARTAAGRLLERAFGRLPQSTRTLAVLHLLDGMTHEEVAAESGLSVSGVRKRLRGLKAVLAQIQGDAR
ncbi:MAG TPA: sigma-70 family RNA polymerase sigma factor [Myxococcaceae bacterium]|nr:sigma-70 family RNA polymerase sigma factor [Myxococcaceae bacterium]